jgi:DNA polymerase III epsilon subunit-like protein
MLLLRPSLLLSGRPEDQSFRFPPAPDVPLAFVDLETTGLFSDRDRIVEIAVLLPDKGLFRTLIRPGDLDFSPAVHGISAADVAGAPPFHRVADAVEALLHGRLLVAHNATFDLAFLQAEFLRSGRSLPPQRFACTISIAEHLGLGHESRSLAYACRHHGVPLRRHHTAAGDAMAAAGLFDVYRGLAQTRRTDWSGAYSACRL